MVNYINESDEVLAQMTAEGDNVAMDEIIRRYGHAVRAIIRNKGCSQMDAEDILQEAYIKAYEALRARRYYVRGKLTGWLVTIAKNVMVSMIRKRNCRPTCALETTEYNLADTSSENLYGKLQQEADLDVLERCVGNLSEAQRKTVRMRLEGRSFKEIAQLLNTNINTVLGNMYNAKAKLQNEVIKRRVLVAEYTK